VLLIDECDMYLERRSDASPARIMAKRRGHGVGFEEIRDLMRITEGIHLLSAEELMDNPDER